MCFTRRTDDLKNWKMSRQTKTQKLVWKIEWKEKKKNSWKGFTSFYKIHRLWLLGHVVELTRWCRAVCAWRPGWSKGPPQAQRSPGGSRGAAAAAWTGRWRSCETDPPLGGPDTATPCPHLLHAQTQGQCGDDALTGVTMMTKMILKRGWPVSVHRSMYTWAAMRQYMSENCSSVFRALLPVTNRTRE